jgi:hypothetical protein
MTTVANGQTLSVTSGQTSTGVIVDFGGLLKVLFGGTISSTIDSGSVDVSSGGKAVATTVAEIFEVFSGGRSIATTIVSGGNEQVTSGALMVSSGGQLVANIDLIGVYSTGDFRLSSGVSGTVEISDPMVIGGGSAGASSAAMVWLRNGVDLPGIADGARTTLVGITDAGKTIGSPPAAAHAAAIALLGNYMAASFVDLAQPQAGASVMESEAVQQPRVTYPHR